MTDASNIVCGENLCVSFGTGTRSESRILKNLNFQMRRGEFVALIGRSGCGKTTLLNVLAGLLSPSQGTVTVDGIAPADAKESVGYMFARDALLPWRTAARNVEYGLEIRGHPRHQRRQEAERLLEAMGLAGWADSYRWQLSQGMRQRVALARTFALKPSILLMDEPFGALDAQTRAALHVEFTKFWESNRRTVVFVTHDISEALILADRVLVMQEGEIVGSIVLPFGRPRDIASLRFQEEFRSMEKQLAFAIGDAKSVASF